MLLETINQSGVDVKFLVLVLALTFTWSACNPFKRNKKPKPTEEISDLQKLDDKAFLYILLSKEQLDEHNFVDGCDSLLWTAIYCNALGDECPTNVFLAEGRIGTLETAGEVAPTGEWFRTALHQCLVYDPVEDDYLDNGSKSSVSRDMLLGLLHYFWNTQDGEAIARLVAHGESSSPEWYIGQAVDDLTREQRTHVRKNLQGTIYAMHYKLNDVDDKRRKNPQFFNPLATGYAAHLQVRHIHLRAKIFGATNSVDLTFLKNFVLNNKSNPYFQVVFHRYKDGDQSEAIKILLDATLWPNNKLPTGAERCEEFLPQRQDNRGSGEGKNWEPCTVFNDDGTVNEAETAEARAEIHIGVDLLDAWYNIHYE